MSLNSEQVVSRLEQSVDADRALLVEMRRDLHAHPELSGQETATTRWIEQHLRDLGLTPTRLECGVGVICDVPVGSGGEPVVVVRADIDALAMQDEKDVGYRSLNDGVAHACGHDVHTTVVIGVARALVSLGDTAPISGTVRLVFEPAEESVPGGAVDVIEEGWLDGVSAVFGLHCDPKTDVGLVGCRVGPLTAAADLVEIRLRGPGGHTARPELTVDLVALLGRLISGLQSELDRAVGEVGLLHLVYGAVRAGDAANVIPGRAILRGTLRTRDHEVWMDAPQLFEAALIATLGSSPVEWEIEHRRGVPPVVNDARATHLLEDAIRRVMGDSAVIEAEESLGGDSFAWYLEKVPGAYARLGTHDPRSTRSRLDLHASTFDVDERAIHHGVMVLASVALDTLAAQ